MSRLRDLRLSQSVIKDDISSIVYDLFHISVSGAQGKGLEKEALAASARAVDELNVDDKKCLLAYWAESTCGRKQSNIYLATESTVAPESKSKSPIRAQRKKEESQK